MFVRMGESSGKSKEKRRGGTDHFSSFQNDGKTFFSTEVKLVHLHAFYEGDCLHLNLDVPILLRESRKLKDLEGEQHQRQWGLQSGKVQLPDIERQTNFRAATARRMAAPIWKRP